MAGNFNMDDYIDVAERIKQFRAKYPEGTLQSHRDPYLVEAGGKTFMVYGAAAYRTPDDPRPGIGWAWEPVPGPTQFTRDSELQNAETAAWGRAIVALGFETKHIASRQEVQNRQGTTRSKPQPAHPETSTNPYTNGAGGMTEKQMQYAHTLATSYTRSIGGVKSVERRLDEGQLPEAVTVALKRDDKGALAWKVGGLSAAEGSAFIDAMKELVEAEAQPA